MCKVLGVSQNCYYAWVSRLPSQRQRYDTAFLTYICASHELNYCSYALQGKRIASFVESGRKRMADELKDQGITIDELQFGRLMLDNDIYVIRTHKFKRMRNSNHNHNIAPNLLGGNFLATGPNQKWAGYISYLWTAEG